MTSAPAPPMPPPRNRRSNARLNRRIRRRLGVDLLLAPSPSPSPYDADTESITHADTSGDEAGTSSAHQQQPIRSSLGNMNSFPLQPRQGPRLQNTNKTGLGGTTSGWGGFGIPSSGGPSAGGFGGLGGAPGLGQGRPQQLSGFAQVMGGGGGQGPIDMSDFPSLSGGPRPQQQNNNNAATGWNSNAIRQTSIQQQPQPPPGQQRAPSAAPSQQSLDQYDGQRSQQQPADRSAGGDDFPPLGGQVNGDVFGGPPNGLSGSSVGSPDGHQPRTKAQQTQLAIRESSGATQQTQQPTSLLTQQQQPQPSQNGGPPPPKVPIQKWADQTEDERWGLPGLSAAYEFRRQADGGGTPDEDVPLALRSAVVMGHDLDSLGMDLGSPDPLHATFTPFPLIGSSNSTFDFHERHVVPDFTLPPAYVVTNVPALSTRLSAFSDETLFSIFYQNPRSTLQELAATELITREWRWHKLLRQWLQKDSLSAAATSNASSLPLVDTTGGAPVGTQPVRFGERGEKGVYVFFDAMNWRRERRVLELEYGDLDAVRVVGLPNGGAGPVGGGGVGRLGQVGGGVEGVGQIGGSSQIVGA